MMAMTFGPDTTAIFGAFDGRRNIASREHRLLHEVKDGLVALQHPVVVALVGLGEAFGGGVAAETNAGGAARGGEEGLGGGQILLGKQPQARLSPQLRQLDAVE